MLSDGYTGISTTLTDVTGIEAFLDEMLSCEAIVSTSLHGLIIANAYGVPARLATFKDSDRQIHGDGMKFEDYFLSIGRINVEALDLNEIGHLQADIASACTDNPAYGIDLDALLAAAPFVIAPSVLATLREPKAELSSGLQHVGGNLGASARFIDRNEIAGV